MAMKCVGFPQLRSLEATVAQPISDRTSLASPRWREQQMKWQERHILRRRTCSWCNHILLQVNACGDLRRVDDLATPPLTVGIDRTSQDALELTDDKMQAPMLATPAAAKSPQGVYCFTLHAKKANISSLLLTHIPRPKCERLSSYQALDRNRL